MLAASARDADEDAKLARAVSRVLLWTCQAVHDVED